MRVLFLSDTHLGIDQPTRPRVTRRRRGDDFFRNYELALAPALRGEVDVVLHGGDLLYRSRVPPSLVETALAPLKRIASLGIPVLIVPGNHERGRIPYPLLTQHPRLWIFDRPRTFVLAARGERVAFAGFPYATRVRARFAELLAATGYARERADRHVLCLHHCIAGATCGPGSFTFRDGDDVIRRADLPRHAELVMSGHIHRHQVMRKADGPPVVYAGSIERTSFAEASETKGFVRVDLGAAGGARVDFLPLPARPMMVRSLSVEGLDAPHARLRVSSVIDATPHDAVLQLRVQGAAGSPATGWLSSAALREISGERNVHLVASWHDRGRRDVAPPGAAPTVSAQLALALDRGLNHEVRKFRGCA